MTERGLLRSAGGLRPAQEARTVRVRRRQLLLSDGPFAETKEQIAGLAEECAQDAFAMALQRWPRDGIPGRPGAWLTTAARNRAIDVLRRRTVGAAKLREVAAMSYEPVPSAADDSGAGESGVTDDRLRLIFTCCHPALSLEARVAL